MSNYHFNRNFIPAHTLAEQLEALKAMLKKRDEAHKNAWADTVPTEHGSFDNDDLDEVNNE